MTTKKISVTTAVLLSVLTVVLFQSIREDRRDLGG